MMRAVPPEPIHDLWIRPLLESPAPRGTAQAALTDAEPLLHRIGLVQVVRLDPQQPPALRVRAQADEIWALLEGRAELRWIDLRQGSPTRGARLERAFDEPVRVLAPFGVAFGVRPLGGPALLLRVATHGDDDPSAADDHNLPWDAAV